MTAQDQRQAAGQALARLSVQKLWSEGRAAMTDSWRPRGTAFGWRVPLSGDDVQLLEALIVFQARAQRSPRIQSRLGELADKLATLRRGLDSGS